MTLTIIMIAYIIGIIWGLYIKNIALFIFVISLLLIIKKYTRIKFSNKQIILIIIVFIISYINILVLENQYNSKLEVQNPDKVNIQAIIISDKKEKDYKNVYTIKIEKINNDERYFGIKLQMSLKNKKEKIEYGDRIYFKGELQNAEGARNYRGFSYKDYLKTNNIYGLVYTTNIEKIEKGKYNKVFILVNSIRSIITKNANKLLDKDEAFLLTSILIGNKNGLEKNIQEDFRNSSLSHILAVSGAHTSYVILTISIILTKLKFNNRIGKIITIVLLILFMILTGASSSVTRACIMAVYIILGSLVYRKPNIITSISTSLLIILAINPYRILDVGLQLSYGGTIGIVLLNNVLTKVFIAKKEKIGLELEVEVEIKSRIQQKLKQKIKESLISMLTVCISANIIIFPIIAYHYNTISLTFFISNVLAGPLLGIIIILGFITIFISFISIKVSKISAYFLSKILKLLIIIAKFSSKLPLSKIYVTTPSIILIIIYYLFLILLINKKVNFKVFKSKKIIAVLIIFVLIFQIVNVLPQDLKIYFIDVGQGDSSLVVTPYKKTILIDGGGSENYDIGTNTLIPYLLDRKIKKIDYIICSHFDTDHIEGLLTVMDELKVKNVVISKQLEDSQNYQKFKQIINKNKIKVIVIQKEDKLKIEKDLYFDIIWPDNENVVRENILNNNSIVCKLNYKSFSMLFTGDIEKIAEKQILEEYKDSLKTLNATILKVGHHGSKTSTTKEFLEAINPKIAVIGVGKNNKFGHPNEDVIKRLDSMNIKIYRTDKSGEISIIVNSKGRIQLKRLIEKEE